MRTCSSQERCPLKSSASHSEVFGSSPPSCSSAPQCRTIQGRRNGSEQNHRGIVKKHACYLGNQAVSITACLQNRSRKRPLAERSFTKAVVASQPGRRQAAARTCPFYCPSCGRQAEADKPREHEHSFPEGAPRCPCAESGGPLDHSADKAARPNQDRPAYPVRSRRTAPQASAGRTGEGGGEGEGCDAALSERDGSGLPQGRPYLPGPLATRPKSGDGTKPEFARRGVT